MASNISGFTKAGELDRRLQLLGLAYTKIKGEQIEQFSEILTFPAQKVEQGGTESLKGGAITHLSTIQFTIKYNSQIRSQIPGYEAMKVSEVLDTPVYLLDFQEQIMYDLFGNPLVDIDNSDVVLYDITDVTEVGRKVDMILTCDRWR